MLVNIAFELDDKALGMLHKAWLAQCQKEFAFINAVHRFMEWDSIYYAQFYDAVFDALAAAVGPKELKALDGSEPGTSEDAVDFLPRIVAAS